jgi:restriction system protein
MTARTYEEIVAEHFRAQGYSVELTSMSNDYGVDIFANIENKKIAIQAKMYGNGRKINREMVMQLYGAKDYFDCTDAIIATNGNLSDSANEVAQKLKILILKIEFTDIRLRVSDHVKNLTKYNAMLQGSLNFHEIWENFIIPLSGKTFQREDGSSNTVITVDWSGLTRLTSAKQKQFIPIEIFRQAIARIIEFGFVTRTEINEGSAKRVSSGVILILAQVPYFKHIKNPSRLVIEN